MVVATVSALLVPAAAQAQAEPATGARVEAIVTVGWGRLARWDDERRYGSGLNVGASLVIRRRAGGVGMALTFDRTFGIAAGPTALSANLRYYFRGGEQVQPYLIGGLGMLRLDARRVAVVPPGRSANDIGFGPNLGFGLVTTTDRRAFTGPEVQWQDGTWRSSLNMTFRRICAGVGIAR